MEQDGAKRCFQYLLDAGISVPQFTSERRVGIAKWLREQHPEIAHYHDTWHIAKSVTKELVHASKESRGGSRPSQHSQLRMSDFLASRFSNLTNLSTQIESDFSRLLTPVPTDICFTLGIPQGSGNLAIVIK